MRKTITDKVIVAAILSSLATLLGAYITVQCSTDKEDKLAIVDPRSIADAIAIAVPSPNTSPPSTLTPTPTNKFSNIGVNPTPQQECFQSFEQAADGITLTITAINPGCSVVVLKGYTVMTTSDIIVNNVRLTVPKTGDKITWLVSETDEDTQVQTTGYVTAYAPFRIAQLVCESIRRQGYACQHAKLPSQP